MNSRAMKIAAFAMFAIVTAMLLKYGGVWDFASPPPPPEKENNEWRAQNAPTAHFQLSGGGTTSLADFRGRVVLLNFWASWCPPCLEEFPRMFDIVSANGGGVALLAVSNDSEREDMDKFLAFLGESHSDVMKSGDVVFAWDPTLEITQQTFNVVRLPETFIIDKDARIVRKVVGSAAWEKGEIDDYLRALANEK